MQKMFGGLEFICATRIKIQMRIFQENLFAFIWTSVRVKYTKNPLISISEIPNRKISE